MIQNHKIAAVVAKAAKRMDSVSVGVLKFCVANLAKAEPLKLPNCMQALNKHKTMYKAAGGYSSKRICIITLTREKAMLMRNTPTKPKR